MRQAGFTAFLILLAIAGISCSKGSGKSSRGDASIAFDTLSHDFGVIPFTEEAECEFVFTNPGSAPLIVSHVKSTCGCTIPDWSREPVKAGMQGTIRVSYDTRRVGAFAKTIYVYSNASNGVQQLTIRGKVIAPDA
jgi:hypothetical protein